MSGYAWYNVFGIPVQVGLDEGMYSTVAGDFGAVTWVDANTLHLEKVPANFTTTSAQFVAVIQLKADRIPIARTIMESATRFIWDGEEMTLTMSGAHTFNEGEDLYNVILSGPPRASAFAQDVGALIALEDEEDGSQSFTFDLRAGGFNTFSLYFSELDGATATVESLSGYDEAVIPGDPPVAVYGPATLAYFGRTLISLAGNYIMDSPQDAAKVQITITIPEANDGDNKVTCYLSRGWR